MSLVLKFVGVVILIGLVVMVAIAILNPGAFFEQIGSMVKAIYEFAASSPIILTLIAIFIALVIGTSVH